MPGVAVRIKYRANSEHLYRPAGSLIAVTVYEPDTNSLSCSGQAFLGSLNTCYNSSWEYYSVDECTVPTLLAATLSATASSTTATASTSATASASSHGGSLSLSAGAVVGIVLGCTVGTACILVAVFMILRRRGSRPVEGSLRPLQEEPGTQPMGDKTALGYSVQSTPTAGQRTTANANWHEVSEQGLAEVPYDNYFPVSRNAELSAEPARPGELPAQRYH